MPIIPIVMPKRSTIEQHIYIDQLAIDLRISDRHRKLAHISDICGREIKYLDDLSLHEAIVVIGKLKEWKEGKKELNNAINQRSME